MLRDSARRRHRAGPDRDEDRDPSRSALQQRRNCRSGYYPISAPRPQQWRRRRGHAGPDSGQPRRALRQFTPPTVHILNDNPRLAMEMAIVAPPDIAMPALSTNIGLPDGILGPPSNGRGRNGGIGDGDGGGVGDRRGPGAGNGGDGGGVTGLTPIRGYITPAVLQGK